MNAQLQTIPQLQTEPIQPQPNIPRWNPALRIAFRFWLIYLGLYCLATQTITTLAGAVFPDPATLWPLRPVIFWTGTHIFHVNASLSAFWGGNSATLDDMFGWVTAFCLLVIATAATVVWSLLDRSRENYAELHKWFRLFVRFALAGQMIVYGFSKVIPVQMPYPSLTRLLQPVGTLSPMGVLWTSMGSAPAYEFFTGCAELAGGLLLIVPRTTTFGALISLAAMIQVFMLNMMYDVPAKRLAFHTMLLACFLLAPDVPRLVRFLLLRRTTSLSTEAQLFRGVRANRIALAAQIIFGLWLVGVSCHYAWVPGIPGAGADRSRRSMASGRCSRCRSTNNHARRCSPTPPVGGAPSSISPTGWPFSAWTIRSFLMAPPSISRRELSPSRRRTTRTGRRASPSSGLPGISSSWMAGWTIIRFIWSFS